MDLVLTYFDNIKGPEIIFTYPETITKKVKNSIKQFFVINAENEFYEFDIEDNRVTNLYFEVPSDWARGNAEMLILSVIARKTIDNKVFHDVLKDASKKALSEQNMFKGLYVKKEEKIEEDPEVKEKYDELQKILFECHSSCIVKQKEVEIMELVTAKGLTLNGAFSVFEGVLVDIISCLLQQKKLILVGDKQASASIMAILKRLFHDVVPIENTLSIKDKHENPAVDELVINTHFGLVENGEINEEANQAINKYLQEAAKKADNDAAILYVRQRLHILITVAEFLEKFLKEKKPVKKILKDIKAKIKISLKVDELHAIRMLLQLQGKENVAENIIVSRLDKF